MRPAGAWTEHPASVPARGRRAGAARLVMRGCKHVAGECFPHPAGHGADDPNGDDPPVRRAFPVAETRADATAFRITPDAYATSVSVAGPVVPHGRLATCPHTTVRCHRARVCRLREWAIRTVPKPASRVRLATPPGRRKRNCAAGRDAEGGSADRSAETARRV